MAFDLDEAKKLQKERKDRQIRIKHWMKTRLVNGFIVFRGQKLMLDETETFYAEVMTDLVNEDWEGLAEALQAFCNNDPEDIAEVSAYIIRLIMDQLVSSNQWTIDWPVAPYATVMQHYSAKTNN